MSAPPILIAAFSGRAAAMAARRAGFAPLVADLFADADTSAIAAGIRRVSGDVETGFDDDALLSALGALTDEAVEPPVGLVYGAGFEDRPALLARIAERWPLLGNRPEVVAAVKEPWGFAEVLAGLGVPHPEIRAVDGALDRDDFRLDQSKIMTAIYFNSLERDSSGKPLHTFPHPALGPGWLVKRQGGAGGSHVGSGEAVVGSGGAICGAAYAQRQVAGRSVSALFLSSDHGAGIVGFSEQWTAPALGRPFRFGGASCPAELPDAVAAALSEAVRKVAYAFALRGLNSADFILGPDGWWLLEINPRLGATLDIFDKGQDGLLAAHIATVRGQHWPAMRPTSSAHATHIVYMSAAISVPPLDWPDWTADRPRADERIPAHGPLCTVFASADTPGEARRLCLQRNEQIQKLMGVEECRTASSASPASA